MAASRIRRNRREPGSGHRQAARASGRLSRRVHKRAVPRRSVFGSGCAGRRFRSAPRCVRGGWLIRSGDRKLAAREARRCRGAQHGVGDGRGGSFGIAESEARKAYPSDRDCDRATSQHLFALQHAISIGEGAEVTLVETHASDGKPRRFRSRASPSARSVVEACRLTEGASAKQLASGGRDAWRWRKLRAGANRGQGAVIARGGRHPLRRPERQAALTGAMALRGHSHADFTLVVDHAAPNCESRELVKAVLGGRSRGVFQGKVIVRARRAKDQRQADGERAAPVG